MPEGPGRSWYVDIHAHACAVPGAPLNGKQVFSTAEQLLKRYDELGVEKGVLLPLVNAEVYEPQSNMEIIGLCRRYPDRLIPFCNVDPRAISNRPDAPLGEWLAFYRDQGCRGIGRSTLNAAASRQA